jgi:hypothetical protein
MTTETIPTAYPVRPGIKYRLRKRTLAHAILRLLCKDMSWYGDPEFKPEDYPKYGYLLGQLLYAFPEKTNEEVDGAVALLRQKAHIYYRKGMGPDPDDHPDYIFPTQKGREAFFDEDYLIANRKDRLDQFALVWRWILPTAGVVALAWLIIAHIQGKI